MPLLVAVTNRSLGPYESCGYQTTFATRCAISAMQDGMSSDPDKFFLCAVAVPELPEPGGDHLLCHGCPAVQTAPSCCPCCEAQQHMPPLHWAVCRRSLLSGRRTPWCRRFMRPVDLSRSTFSDKQTDALGPTHQAPLADMHTCSAPGDATARSLSLLTRNSRISEATAEMTVAPGL